VKKQLVILGLFGVTVLGTPAFAELFDESLLEEFRCTRFYLIMDFSKRREQFLRRHGDGTFQFHEVGVNFLTIYPTACMLGCSSLHAIWGILAIINSSSIGLLAIIAGMTPFGIRALESSKSPMVYTTNPRF
jgi:hypothetical protein